MFNIPLSEECRPETFDKIIGQEHLVGPNGFITKIIENCRPLSIILWGPPGSGKTTIARLYARAFSLRFESLSAVFSGVADLKKILREGDQTPLLQQTIVLFIDEIHRFNKAQQDAFLPYLESGKLILVGATAENPSFYLNNALLSRVRVLKLNALTEEYLQILMETYERKYGILPLEQAARKYLIQLAGGDGRYLFNLIENVLGVYSGDILSVEEIENQLQRRAPLSDRDTDQHYNLISALHKSLRGSDPDAGLYWFARLLNAGEDPLFIARRLIRMASEDIGLADPHALQLAIAARDAYMMLGSPEGELTLAQVVVYLALAPKSNALYKAFDAAKEAAIETGQLDPPNAILNASTKLMKEIGYGRDYVYDHDTQVGFSGQNYFPDMMKRRQFYFPVERGFEREMKKRISYFFHLRCAAKKSQKPKTPG